MYRNYLLFFFCISFSFYCSVFFFSFLLFSLFLSFRDHMSLLHHAVCVYSLRSVFRQRSFALIGRRINADRDFSRISYAFTFNFDVPCLAGALINEASFHSSRALGGAYRRRCVARAFANRTCDVSLVSAIRDFVSYYLPLRARESRQARGPLSLSISFSFSLRPRRC